MGSFNQLVELGLLGQHHGAALDEVGLDQRALGHLAGGLVRLDGRLRGVVTVGGVAQEDDAEHRHGVFAGGQLGVGAELVGSLPEAGGRFRSFVVLGYVAIYRRPCARLGPARSGSGTVRPCALA